MAATYNAVIDQGADWFVNFTYQDSTGTPINLTGYTAAMQLRAPTDSLIASLSLSSPSNGITITPLTGLVAVRATAAQTGALIDGIYEYDLELTSGSGIVTRLVQGQLTLSPQVTR
jgi:hypothetical protein